MKLKSILYFVLVGIICLVIGTWLGMRSKSVYTLGWVNIHVQTPDFIFEISIKDRSILKHNTIKFIEQTFNAGIHEILGDLLSPLELRKYIDYINHMASEQKMEVLKEYMKQYEEKKKNETTL